MATDTAEAIGDFAKVLAAEADPDKLISRVKLEAMQQADDATFELPALSIVPAGDFGDVDEAGAEALMGDDDDALIPRNADVMVYGNGGAGKTTLTLDMGCHLAAGVDWLGYTVDDPVRVLMIEAEGPRAQFRKKVRRKMATWRDQTQERLSVLDSPWCEFTFASAEWRERLAAVIQEHEIDVVIVGPLTAIGMDDAGTLQQTRGFLKLIADTRTQAKRPVTFVVVHHENKAGSVSGAWESVGDTLLHVIGGGHGSTIVHIQKARWSPSAHGKQIKLAWTDDEGFAVSEEENLLTQILGYYEDDEWHSIDQTRKAVSRSYQAVADTLGDDKLFDHVTGDDAKQLGFRSTAKMYRRKPLPGF